MLWATLLLLLLIIFPLWDYLRRKKLHDQLPEPPAGRSSHVNGPGNVLPYRGIHGERIMGYALENIGKYGCKHRIWICADPTKFLTTDPRDVFRETSFKVFPIVVFPVNAPMNPNPYMNETPGILEVTDLSTVQRMDWIYSPLGRRQEVLIQTLHDFTTTIWQLPRDDLQMEQQLCNYNDYDELERDRRQAMLDMLLLQGALSTDEGEENTHLIADSKGNTSGLMFCLYEISGESSGQDGMGNECDKGLDHDNTHCLAVGNCLNGLECLECAVKEPLHTTVSPFGCNLKDYIETRGKLIPVGTNITVGIYALLRDPHEYEARRRHEEQSLQKQLNQRNPFANILIFSAGPRVLGMKSAISKVLQSYKVLPLPASPRVAMSPRAFNGIHPS